jgi:MFS family permease
VATAIYGPVTVAYVAELSQARRAERLGWFSMARNAGYVVGPAVAGWLLVSMDPVAVFTVIGLVSAAAFLPIVLLPETVNAASGPRTPIARQALRAIRAGGATPAVWLAGGLEANVFVAVYAVKAFLPLQALSMGAGIALAGAFLAVQEAVHIVLNPVGGRLGDRLGYLTMASAGMAVLGIALVTMTFARTGLGFMAPAVLIGVAQALALPAGIALVSKRVGGEHLGAGMGLVGSMKNAGKVAGPMVAGALIFWLDFGSTFRLMGAALLIAAALAWTGGRFYSAKIEVTEGLDAA